MFLEGLLVVTFLTVVVLLLIPIRWYFIYNKYKKCLNSFCTISQTLLIEIGYQIRNTVDFYYVMLSYAKKIKDKNYFAMIGPYPILFTWDPKIFSLILGSSKHINKPSLYNVMENLFANSLILTNGNIWRRQRKLLNPAFDYQSVLQNIDCFNAQSDNLIQLLDEEVNKESTDVSLLLENWALQQVYDTMVGDNESVKDKTEFQNAINCLYQIAITRYLNLREVFLITYVFTKNYWLERKMLKVVFDHVWNIINKKRLETSEETNKREKPILIDILMKQKDIDKNITYDFIVKQLSLMIAGGFDTTATTVSYILHNLSIFPEIQKKAYNEVYSILGDDINQFITHEHIKEMKYLDLVIKESMRIKTTAPYFFRQLEEDVVVDGTTLPKGLIIGMLAYVMHLDPDVYPEPEKFVPERFLIENLNPNKYSYVPFAGGIRNCIGYKYAMLAMKVVLAKILLNYEVVDVKHELCLATEILLKSKTGVKVGIRRRNITKEL